MRRKRTTLLFDCDNTLVLSEELAFQACCTLINEVLYQKRVNVKFTPEQLMERFVGSAFRQIITTLGDEYSFKIPQLEMDHLVHLEEDQVIEALESKAKPTPGANDLLETLVQLEFPMAVVSSSAIRRVKASLKSTKQEHFFGDRIYSAADSLPQPETKPSPAIYLHAIQQQRVKAEQCIAFEDSRSGVLAAVRARIPVIGYVGCLPVHKQAERVLELLNAGAASVIQSWENILPLLENLSGVSSAHR